MKITIKEVRRIIRETLIEADDRQTIPAQFDPHEKELQKKHPTWGSPSNRLEKEKLGLPAQSPLSVKLKQITSILNAKGHIKDASSKKKITQELPKFLSELEPSDLFVADPDDLATEFAQSVLGVKSS